MPSSIRGRSFGSIIAVDTGRGELTGCEDRVVVRYESASRRWVSDFEVLARER